MSNISILIIHTKFISGAHAIPGNIKPDLHLPFPGMQAKRPHCMVNEAEIRKSTQTRANMPSPELPGVRIK